MQSEKSCCLIVKFNMKIRMTSSLNEGGTAVFRPSCSELVFFGGKAVKTFQIKQKMWSLGGKFTITDEAGLPSYEVVGSFMQIPKTFTIYDMQGKQISQIQKKTWALLPKFYVNLSDGSSFFLKKDLSFFKPHYTIEDLGMEIQGDFWDMNFRLLKDGQEVASISQEWLRLTSTYNIDVYDDQYADLVISLVIAIDYVKEMEHSAANSSSN